MDIVMCDSKIHLHCDWVELSPPRGWHGLGLIGVLARRPMRQPL